MYTHFQKKAIALGNLHTSWWSLIIHSRVAKSVIADAGEEVPEEEEEETTSKGKGVSGLFLRYLEEEWDKGSKKVPNPNQKTRQRFPSVSFTTAFKEQKFKKKILSDFQKWKEKDKKDSRKEDSEKKPSKPTKPSSSKKHILEVDEARIEKLASEFKETISKELEGLNVPDLRSRMESRLRSSLKYADSYRGKSSEKVDEHLRSIMDRMSDGDLKVYHLLDTMPYSVTRLFTQQPETREARVGIQGFVETVTSRQARKIMGALGALGIPGSIPDYEKGANGVEEQRQEGKDDKKLAESAKAMYEATQAFFRAMGMERITVYRGMNSINDSDIETGSSIIVRSRELSSTTISPDRAHDFGRVVSYDVPVSQIFAMPNLCGAATFSGELEVIAAGLDEVEATVSTEIHKKSEIDSGVSYLKSQYESKQKKSGMKMADKKKKPTIIQPTRDDDDWLAVMRKNEKKGEKPKGSKSKSNAKTNKSK